MKYFIYSILFFQILATKNNQEENLLQQNSFFIEHNNDRNIEKVQLCSPDDLHFLKPFYVDYMFKQNISLLTSSDEINHKMCQKMVFRRSPNNVYLFVVHLGKTEYFNTKQSCNVAIQFKQVNEQEKDEHTQVLREDDVIKYLQETPITFGAYVRKERCEKVLKNESDNDFAKRLKSKLDDKYVHEKIKYQMTKKIQQAPESFASTLIVPNNQLKDALSKEAYVRVLYEQFDCFALRLDCFKDIIQDKEEQVKQIVTQYMIMAQPALKKFYQEQTKEFQQNLQNQLADKITQVAANKGVHMFTEQICPNMNDNLTQGIAQAVVSFLFETAFQVGTRVVGSIVNNTVGRIYRGITGLVNRNKHSQRNFKFCFDYKELKIQDILQQKVHGILKYEVQESDLASCMAEKIEINNALLGFEVRMQINSQDGLCFLNVFFNSAGVINYLQPEKHELTCASFNPFEQGDQFNSIIELDPSQLKYTSWEGTSVDPIGFNTDFKNELKSHPLQFNDLDLEELYVDPLNAGKFQYIDDEVNSKFRII